MITPNVVSWQWEDYATAHRSRANLAIHALTNPLFLGGIVFSIARLSPFGLIAAVVAMALQGRGHAGEPNPPQPFRSPLDLVVRIFVEQFVTFPRFVLSGRFAEAWRRGVLSTS